MTSRDAPAGGDSPLLDWLGGQQDAMVDLLRTIVNIDSNSYDKAGIDRAGDALRAFAGAHGVASTTRPISGYGDILRFEVPGGNGAPILLMGHRDTVFPTGTVASRPFSTRDGRAYGPGVADMKAGLVLNCFVLAAFARFGGAPAPLVGLITGDEEIASPASRPVIEDEARAACIALNAEAGRANGNLVIARRGCIFIDLEIEGRSAHSGVNFDDGRSAIEELARKVSALHGLSRPHDQVTVNVGIVAGGQSVNTVAPNASAKIDVRYYEPRDRERILGEVARIVEHAWVPGTKASWRLYGEFPPMNATKASEAMLAIYRDSAREFGLDLDGELTAGAADSGFSAAVGTPTLCGLGPVGGRYHSDDEYVEIASMVPRAQALARMILRLAGHPDLLGRESAPAQDGRA